jgi:hypothetical protein
MIEAGKVAQLRKVERPGRNDSGKDGTLAETLAKQGKLFPASVVHAQPVWAVPPMGSMPRWRSSPSRRSTSPCSHWVLLNHGPDVDIGHPLLLPPRHVGEQLPFPVAQRRGLLDVIDLDPASFCCRTWKPSQ